MQFHVFILVAMLCCWWEVVAVTKAGTPIDGCRAVQQDTANATAIIAVQPPTTSSLEVEPVLVQFIDCTIPSDLNVIIAVPATTDNSHTAQAVFIDIKRTHMVDGGSFSIVPTIVVSTDSSGDDNRDQSSATEGLSYLENVHVTIDHCVLEGAGDMVVVNATQSATRSSSSPQDSGSVEGSSLGSALVGVRNVTITVQNSILTSSALGNVASILTGRTDEESRAENVKIEVGSNTTLQTEGSYTASLVANNIANVSLVLDSSSCRGPVHLSSGRDDRDATAGTLSILPPPEIGNPARIMLRLQDGVHILVTDGMCAAEASCGGRSEKTKSIDMSSKTKYGVAACASVVAWHLAQADMLMMGNVSISVHLHGSQELQVGSRGSSVDAMHAFTATAMISWSVTVVGGVVAHTHGYSTPSISTMNLVACDLNVVFNVSSRQSSPKSVLINTTVATRGGHSVAVVMGIGIYCISESPAILGSFTAKSGSNVRITSLITSSSSADRGGSVALHAMSHGVSTILGLAIMTHGSRTSHSTRFKLSEHSNMYIASNATASGGGRIQMICKAQSSTAASILGLAVNGRARWGAPPTVHVLFTESSTFNVAAVAETIPNTSSVEEADDNGEDEAAINIMVTVLKGIADSVMVASIMGISINSYCTDSSPTANMAVDQGSSIFISSSSYQRGGRGAAAGRINITSFSGEASASTVAGIAVNSYSWQAASMALFTVSSYPCRIVIITVSKGWHEAASPQQRHTNGIILAALSPGGYGCTSAIGIAVSATTGSRDAGLLQATFKGQVELATVLSDAVMIKTGVGNPTKSAVALLGVALFEGGTQGTVFIGNQPQSSARTVEFWASITNNSSINITDASSFASVLGMLATKTVSGVTPANTALGLCHDSTFGTPDLGLDERSGVVLGVKPAATTSPPTVQQSNIADGALWCTGKMETVSTDLDAHLGLGQTMHDAVRFFPSHNLDSGLCRALEELRFETPTFTRGTPSSSSTRTPSTSLVNIHTPTASSSSTPLEEEAMSTPTLTPLPQHRTTATRTATLGDLSTSNPAENNITNEPPPQSSPPPKRSVKIVANLLLPESQTTATVVLSTAGASTAVASTLGSGGGGVLVVAGSSVRMMECGLAEDEPKPATFELPIQFAVGNGAMKYFAGAALGHSLLQCVLFAAPILLRRHTQRDTHIVDEHHHRRTVSKPVTYLSMLFCGTHAFFTPAILGACSTVLFNGDGDSAGLLVAGCSAAIIVAINGLVTAAVHFGPQHGLVAKPVRGAQGQKMKLEFELRSETTTTSSNSSSDNEDDDNDNTEEEEPSSTNSSNSANNNNNSVIEERRSTISALFFSAHSTRDVLLTLFDGCRAYEKATHRHYASIETILYSVIAMISGARPQQNCDAAAFAIAVLAGAHLLYIAVVRPFRTMLDTIFSSLNSALLVVLSIAVTISIRSTDTAEGEAPPQGALKTVEGCLWLISIMGFVQLGVQGYWTYHVAQRKLHREDEDSNLEEMNDEVETAQSEQRKKTRKLKNKRNSCSGDSDTSQPLLTVAFSLEKENEQEEYEQDGIHHNNPLRHRI